MLKNRIIYLSLLFFIGLIPLNGQDEPTDYESLANIEGNRAEIQRYFGYEDLMLRFTTLPYDVSQNINQTGYFVDIGYVLLALIPIVILSLLYKRPKTFYTILTLSLIYLLSCFAYSHVRINDQIFKSTQVEKLNAENFDIFDQVLTKTYSISNQLTQFYLQPLNKFIFNNNWVVYLSLFSVFALTLLRIKRYSLANTMWIIFSSFLFLWLLLSGGILWYGFILIPLGTILIIKHLDKLNSLSPIVKNLGLMIFFIWIFLAGISRISYVSYQNNEGEHAGKSLINGNLFLYSVGQFNGNQTMNITAPSISRALDRINLSQELVYMIGTSYSFNINNNYKRIYNDPDLTGFYWVQRKFPSKADQIGALKASGFKFIVVDLHIPSLDKTPEQSLVSKYKLLMRSLYQNPAVSLISTDRIVEYVNSEGKAQKLANVFGQKVVNFGSYAIYEIL